MATSDLIGAPAHADHPVPVRLTGSPNWHYAAMRRYESAARNLSERIISADADRAALKAQRDDYYAMASAYRNAAHRRERAEKFWASRPGTLIRLVARGLRIVRSAVAA